MYYVGYLFGPIVCSPVDKLKMNKLHSFLFFSPLMHHQSIQQASSPELRSLKQIETSTLIPCSLIRAAAILIRSEQGTRVGGGGRWTVQPRSLPLFHSMTHSATQVVTIVLVYDTLYNSGCYHCSNLWHTIQSRLLSWFQSTTHCTFQVVTMVPVYDTV